MKRLSRQRRLAPSPIGRADRTGAVDIEAWLSELGLERFAQAFRDNQIDARSLPHLTGDDLRELGVTALGHRRLLLHAIADLQKAKGSEPKRALRQSRALSPSRQNPEPSGGS